MPEEAEKAGVHRESGERTKVTMMPGTPVCTFSSRTREARWCSSPAAVVGLWSKKAVFGQKRSKKATPPHRSCARLNLRITCFPTPLPRSKLARFINRHAKRTNPRSFWTCTDQFFFFLPPRPLAKHAITSSLIAPRFYVSFRTSCTVLSRVYVSFRINCAAPLWPAGSARGTRTGAPASRCSRRR